MWENTIVLSPNLALEWSKEWSSIVYYFSLCSIVQVICKIQLYHITSFRCVQMCTQIDYIAYLQGNVLYADLLWSLCSAAQLSIIAYCFHTTTDVLLYVSEAWLVIYSYSLPVPLQTCSLVYIFCKHICLAYVLVYMLQLHSSICGVLHCCHYSTATFPVVTALPSWY